MKNLFRAFSDILHIHIPLRLKLSLLPLWIALVSAPLNGAVINWDGVTGGWETAANWSTLTNATTPNPASPPVAGDAAIFNITTVNGAETISLNADQAAASLTFKNTGTTSINGNTAGSTARNLTLSAGFISINAGTGAVTLGGNGLGITIGSSQTWTNNSSNLFTVSSNVTNGAVTQLSIAGTGNTLLSGVYGGNSGPLVKSGTGTLTLTGSNTYTGVTTISGGTLVLGSSTALSNVTNVTASAGILSSNVANSTLGGNLTLSGGGITPGGAGSVATLTLSAGKNFTFSSGTLTLDLANAGSFDQILGTGTSNFTISGGTIDFSGTAISDYSSTYSILNGFKVTGNSVNNLTFSGYDTSLYAASLGTNGLLSFTAIPEPTVFQLFFIFVILVGGYQRLRSSVKMSG